MNSKNGQMDWKVLSQHGYRGGQQTYYTSFTRILKTIHTPEEAIDDPAVSAFRRRRCTALCYESIKQRLADKVQRFSERRFDNFEDELLYYFYGPKDIDNYPIFPRRK